MRGKPALNHKILSYEDTINKLRTMVDFQELYNAVNNEKTIDEKYFYKYMNKGNKNKIFDGSGLKIFKLLSDGLK